MDHYSYVPQIMIQYFIKTSEQLNIISSSLSSYREAEKAYQTLLERINSGYEVDLKKHFEVNA